MSRIAFDFPLAIYAGLPVAAAVLALSAWSKHRRGIGRWQLTLSLLFRGVALLILVVQAARPVRVDVRDKEKPRPTVFLLVDRSASMSLEDEETTRYGEAVAFARSELLPAVKRADLRPRAFLFAEDVIAADGAQVAAAIPDGKATNLSGAIVLALASTVNPPFAAIALTDGAANVSEDNARALAVLLESGTPFVGVGFGTETGLRGLSLCAVTGPSTTSVNEQFRISAELEMNSPDEMPQFDLLLLRDGKLRDTKRVSAGSGQRLWMEGFDIKEEREGVYTYAVQLQRPAVEGLRCPSVSGAARVRVFKSREVRVLFAQEAPTWNYKFVRLALRGDPTIKLTGLTRTSRQSVLHQNPEIPGELVGEFPSKLEEIAPFRVVVLSNFKPSDLTAGQQDLLKRFCRDFGGGILMIGDAETFGPSWHGSQLDPLLPVRFASSASPRQPPSSFQLRLTQEALTHPVFELGGEGRQGAAWDKLPAFSGYACPATAKLGARVWAISSDGRGPGRSPCILMAEQRYGAGISAVICIHNFWQWRLAKDGEPQQFDRFWRQLIRYLGEVRREEVEIGFPEQELSPNADIRVTIQRQPDPRFPQAARDYIVRIEDAEKRQVEEHAVSIAPDRAVEVTFRVPTSGDYSVSVIGADGVLQATRTVEIREANIEFRRTARDMENLRQWASLTGGIAVRAEDCHDAEKLLARITTKTEHPLPGTDRRMPIGLNHWVLSALLACLCAEWVLRKRWELP